MDARKTQMAKVDPLSEDRRGIQGEAVPRVDVGVGKTLTWKAERLKLCV